MRGYRIDRFGVTEVEGEFEELVDPSVDWDVFDLDERNDVWVHDEGLFEPGVVLARIGPRSRVPLPAVVLGAEGERSVDAAIGLEDLLRLVRIEGSMMAAVDGGRPRRAG